MLKKSLAWVLTLALLLSTLSGLALITAANENAKFAFASYTSGEPLYKNATQQVYSASGVMSTPMAGITGTPTDRSAAYLAYQNSQVGLAVASSVGLGSNVTIEVKFWTDEDNLDGTRLGMSYTKADGDCNPGELQVKGMAGGEYFYIGSGFEAEDNISHTADGWTVATLTVTDADYSNGGHFILTKWSHDNGDITPDGWYVAYILIYDTATGRPDDADLYIREDTVGYIDFTGDEVEKSLLSYTTDASVTEFDGMNALKIEDPDDCELTVVSDPVEQPAVIAEDTDVTLMLEYYGGDEWYVARFDLHNIGSNSLDLAPILEGAPDPLYIRKIVFCRTAMVSEYENDFAFLDLDNPYAQYNDFNRVTDTTYDLMWKHEEGTGTEIKDDDGKTAVYMKGGYLCIDVADGFTKRGAANVPDVNITITYLDGAQGDLTIGYNKIVPAGEEDGIPYQFAEATAAKLTNSGEWATSTLYLSDAQFRNGANGYDFRINAKEGVAISAVEVRIGADKAALKKWIDKVFNSSKYTPESVAAYENAKNSVASVYSNNYATKAQVDAAVKAMSDAFDALVAKEGGADSRFTMDGVLFNIPAADQGEITTLDGWYVWKFTPKSSSKFIGIGDENGILKDSKSVTYEYEILMDTTNNNDRCFLGYGETKDGWHGVEEGAFAENPDTGDYKGNGFAAGGFWGAVPSTGRWGTITITNDRYDPTALRNGNITELGSWMDEGTLYVRSIKAYDTEDPEKCISLQFNEDVAELIVNPGDSSVVLTEKEGYPAYRITEDWRCVNMDVPSLLAQGVLTADSQYVAIEFEYWLDDTDNGNELLMIKHYNPDGTGDNGNKAEVCEHQKRHGDLNKRNQWAKATYILDDGDFGDSVKTFNITYGNGEAIYIRGIKVYAIDEEGTMTSERAACWGTMDLSNGQVSDHAFWDFDLDDGYGMTVSFSEGSTATAFKTYDSKYAAQVTDDFVYIKVDDQMVTERDRYVRIDLTIVNGSTLYARYNKVLPAGVDDSAEPNLTQYRFHASGENEVIGEDGANHWIAGEGDFVNMLGVIKPCNSEYNWEVQSIYLTDAQFRNAANGSDLRLHFVDGGGYITRIDVYVISESDVPVLAGAEKVQELTDYVAALDAKYGNDAPDEVYEALFDLEENYLPYCYRATGEEIQAKMDALKALEEKYPAPEGIPGDVDGDGKVTTTDARLALQVAAKKIDGENLNLAVGDVDGKEGISTTDARMILQCAAKKITL